MVRTLTFALIALGACRRRSVPQERLVAPPAPQCTNGAPANVASAPVDPVELQPGDTTAFGVVLPLGSHLRVENDSTKMYYVDARMPQVMRYLQRRLEFHQGDVHPLGAMIREARISGAGVALVVDVGVRDEGERTLVTVWNRTPPAVTQRSDDEGYRAAGIDPSTGAALPQYNY